MRLVQVEPSCATDSRGELIEEIFITDKLFQGTVRKQFLDMQTKTIMAKHLEC